MKAYISISILFFCTSISAQEPSYIQLAIKNGLPSNLIYCGLQDKKYNLWFGTDKGLVSFNNKRVRVFTTKEALPDPEVLNLWEDSDENLWISCFRRNLCYRKKGRIIDWNSDKRLQMINLTYGMSNFFEEEKKIWFSTNTTTAYLLDNDTVLKKDYPDALFRITRVNNRLVGFGTTSIIDINENLKPRFIFKFDKKKTDYNPAVSIESLGNRVLYSFRNIIYLIEINEGIAYKIDSIENLSGKLSTDRRGRFWVCSPAIGAICFDNDKRDLSNPKLYLAGKKTIYMFEDHQGTFWFCTMDDGIYALPVETPVNYSKDDGLPSNNIMSVARDNNGDILCGDDEGNLNVINANGIKTVQYKSIDGYNRILSVLPDRKNGKWVVTDEGLYYERGGKRKQINIRAAAPKVILPQGDNIWCGTSSRLYLISGTTLDTFPGKLYKRVTAVGIDSEENVWAGGIEGVYCSKDAFRKNWGDKFPALRSRIVSIQGGPKDEIWVVTPDSGLLRCRVREGRLTGLLKANDFLKQPIENIQSLFKEENGRLWLATNHGIYSVDPDTWAVGHISQFDGLPNNDVRSILVHRDTLWAGTASGVTRVLLNRTPVNGNYPTYITSVHYQRQKTIYEIQIQDSIPPDQEIILPPDASLVEIEFTGLDYRSRGNLTYECLITEVLLPFSWWTVDNLSTWFLSRFKGKTDTNNVHRANLNFGINWPAGRYNIKVTALSAGVVRSLFPDQHTFVMRPHWYATLWSYVLVWGIIGSGLYRIYQTRVQLDKMATAVARSRLFALQAQINPHFVGNAINAVQRYFYPPAPAEASLYTATLTSLLRQTLLFSEKTFIPFREEIEFDRNYLDLTRSRLGTERFHYTFSGVEDIHAETPFPALFLQPILENATIHGLSRSGISRIDIAFRARKGRLYCTVTDNGPGLPPSGAGAGESRPAGENRQSKGIAMLRNKAATLNQLYDLDLKFVILNAPNDSGARAIVSFRTDKAIKAQYRPFTIADKEPFF